MRQLFSFKFSSSPIFQHHHFFDYLLMVTEMVLRNPQIVHFYLKKTIFLPNKLDIYDSAEFLQPV